MQLIKLIADKDTFHPVCFKEGINIIVGKRSNPNVKNDRKTFNGVGKSLVIHLIHFCLCSNKIDALNKSLPDWNFTLFFSCEGVEHYISRNTSEQGIVILDGQEYKLNGAREILLDMVIPDKEVKKYINFQPLLSKFIRRFRQAYIRYDDSNYHPDMYMNLLYNGLLLGLDVDLITKKKELREEQDKLKKTERTIKSDKMFKQYYLGNEDAQMDMDVLEFEIEKLEKELAEFKISNNYHEIEERANMVSYEKKEVENKLVVVENNIKNIKAALEIQADSSMENVVRMYKEASVEIAEMLRKTLEEVENFHRKLLQTRNARLKEELRKNEEELKKLTLKIEELGEEMDRLLRYLNTHGALEEYTSLNKQLADYQVQLNHIKEYQELIKAFQKKQTEIKNQLIAEDQYTLSYLEDSESVLKGLRKKYVEMTKEFYPNKKSGLSIENNARENQVRFNIEARIEDDSSDGVNEVKIFCFDMLMLLQKTSNIRFAFHDSRLLANMDPRQRTILYRLAFDICSANGFQYITSINDDALESIKNIMDSDEEYVSIMEDGIILTLNDDSEESKLLGIQVDMDLEG